MGRPKPALVFDLDAALQNMTPAASPVAHLDRDPKTLTVKDMADLYERYHLSTLKDPRTVRAILRNYFPPLHHRLFHLLKPLEILAWSNVIRKHSNIMANQSIKVLRGMYNRASEWNLFDGLNPAAKVRVSARCKRSTFIREDEMGRVIATILREPYPDRLYFMAMLVLAPRPGELNQMRVQDLRLWQVEGEWHGEWTKPKHTTKKHREHVVPIPSQLASMFALWLQVRGEGFDWMFPSSFTDGEPISKEKWHAHWDEIRRKAGIPHIWLYDLRRTGATWATDATGNLSAVSRGMLGHANFTETTRYVQQMGQAVKQVIVSHETRLLKCAEARRDDPPPAAAAAVLSPPPAPAPCLADAMDWPG